MDKIKIPKKVAEFIESSGELIVDWPEKFMHYPFWLKKNR
jgi:hypothetical protein